MSVSFKDRLCWWRKIRIGKGAGGDRDHVRFAGGPPEDGAAAVRAKMECHVISAVRGPGVSCAVSEDLHFGLRVEGGDAEIPACTALALFAITGGNGKRFALTRDGKLCAATMCDAVIHV